MAKLAVNVEQGKFTLGRNSTHERLDHTEAAREEFAQRSSVHLAAFQSHSILRVRTYSRLDDNFVGLELIKPPFNFVAIDFAIVPDGRNYCRSARCEVSKINVFV